MIKRKKFLIRKMTINDISSEFIENLNNKKNNKYLDIKKKKQTKKTVFNYFQTINNDGDYYLGVFKKKKLAGTITLRHKKKKSAHIGFLIFQNKNNEVNFSYQVIKALLRHMNSKKIFTRFFAGTDKKNLSSNFLLTALGFKLKKIGINNFSFELKYE